MVVIVVVATSLAVLTRRKDQYDPLQPPTPHGPSTDLPPPTPTETPSELVEFSTEWVVVEAPTATPSPWPTVAMPATVTPRPDPSPTPRTSECVTFRWSAGQVFRPSALVMVEINAVNRCNRDLGSLDLWFEITGWRQGAFVQSVRGHPFDRVRKGGSEIIAVGLPGSIDWYDEITVEIVD